MSTNSRCLGISNYSGTSLGTCCPASRRLSWKQMNDRIRFHLETWTMHKPTPTQQSMLQFMAEYGTMGGQYRYNGYSHRPQTIRACLSRGWIAYVSDDHRTQEPRYELTYLGYRALGI